MSQVRPTTGIRCRGSAPSILLPCRFTRHHHGFRPTHHHRGTWAIDFGSSSCKSQGASHAGGSTSSCVPRRRGCGCRVVGWRCAAMRRCGGCRVGRRVGQASPRGGGGREPGGSSGGEVKELGRARGRRLVKKLRRHWAAVGWRNRGGASLGHRIA
jgi:hypothetical protein